MLTLLSPTLITCNYTFLLFTSPFLYHSYYSTPRHLVQSHTCSFSLSILRTVVSHLLHTYIDPVVTLPAWGLIKETPITSVEQSSPIQLYSTVFNRTSHIGTYNTSIICKLICLHEHKTNRQKKHHF